MKIKKEGLILWKCFYMGSPDLSLRPEKLILIIWNKKICKDSPIFADSIVCLSDKFKSTASTTNKIFNKDKGKIWKMGFNPTLEGHLSISPLIISLQPKLQSIGEAKKS